MLPEHSKSVIELLIAPLRCAHQLVMTVARNAMELMEVGFQFLQSAVKAVPPFIACFSIFVAPVGEWQYLINDGFSLNFSPHEHEAEKEHAEPCQAIRPRRGIKRRENSNDQKHDARHHSESCQHDFLLLACIFVFESYPMRCYGCACACCEFD